MRYFKIYIINKNYNIYSNKNKYTLLKILELHNIKIESQCRQGYCGYCRIYLKKGNIYYPKKNQPIAYLKPGEICSCCCYLQGNIDIII